MNRIMATIALILLNTSTLTSYGTFTYRPLSLEEARELVRETVAQGIAVRSAIGHEATAELLTRLLQYPVAAQRIEVRQAVNETVLVFKLKGRVAEGRVLTLAELEEVGYEFGLLTRSA